MDMELLEAMYPGGIMPGPPPIMSPGWPIMGFIIIMEGSCSPMCWPYIPSCMRA
jgi:hypothetical protein